MIGMTHASGVQSWKGTLFEDLSKNTAQPSAEESSWYREDEISCETEYILPLQRETYAYARPLRRPIEESSMGLSQETIEFLTPCRLDTELRNGKRIMNIFSFSIISLGDITKSQSFKHHLCANDGQIYISTLDMLPKL